MADDNNVSEKLDPVKMASTSPSASTKDKNLTHYRYNSTEILALQNSQLSRTRPAWLSKEFDKLFFNRINNFRIFSAKGEFSPDKWIQHLWQCQGGVENINKRPNAKNLVATGASAYPTPNVLSAIMEAASNGSSEIDQQTILSPQRRGFSSGCRAASPKNGWEFKNKKIIVVQLKIWTNIRQLNRVGGREHSTMVSTSNRLL